MSAPPVDWKARAEREAAAILDGFYRDHGGNILSHSQLVNLVAIAWLQGAIVATHADLADFEQGFDRMRAAL